MKKNNKEMDLKQQLLGTMEMILVVVLMTDMLIVMSRSQVHLFLNLDRFVGLSTFLSLTGTLAVKTHIFSLLSYIHSLNIMM